MENNIGISIYGTYGGFNIFYSHNVDKNIEKSFLDINGYFNFSVGKELYSVSFYQDKKIYTFFRTARDHVKRDGFYAIVLVVNSSYKFKGSIFEYLKELANLFQERYTYRNNINNVLHGKIEIKDFLDRIKNIELVEHKAASFKKQKALIYAEKSSDVIKYINDCNTFEFDYLFIIPQEFQFNIKTLAETGISKYDSFENFKEKNKTQDKLNIENSNFSETTLQKRDNDVILKSIENQDTTDSANRSINNIEEKSTQTENSLKINEKAKDTSNENEKAQLKNLANKNEKETEQSKNTSNKNETTQLKDISNKNEKETKKSKNTSNKNGIKKDQKKNSLNKNKNEQSLDTIDKTEDSPGLIKRIVTPITGFYQKKKKIIIGSVAALILISIAGFIYLNYTAKEQKDSNIANKQTRTDSNSTKNGVSQVTEIENRKNSEIKANQAKIESFTSTPTLAKYRELNITERKDSDVIRSFTNLLAKPTLTNAFNYTQTMDFEPTSRFKIKTDSLVAYIKSVKDLYCLNTRIGIKIMVIKAKRFPEEKANHKIKNVTTDTTLTILDIYRKLLVVKEILGKYNEIANFKTGKISTKLAPIDTVQIKEYRILLFNYRGAYGPKIFGVKNPYGLVKQQYQDLYNLGLDLYKLYRSKVAPTYYDKNGKEQKRIVWGRIDSIIDKSCKNRDI